MDQQPAQVQSNPATPTSSAPILQTPTLQTPTPQAPPAKPSSSKRHLIINIILSIVLIILIFSSLVAYLRFFPQKQSKKLIAIPDQCPLQLSPCKTATIIKSFPDYPNITGLLYRDIPAGTKVIAIDTGIISSESATLLGRKQIVLNDLKGHAIFYSLKSTSQFTTIDPSLKVKKGDILAIMGSGEKGTTSSLFLTAQGASRSSILIKINPNQTLKPF